MFTVCLGESRFVLSSVSLSGCVTFGLEVVIDSVIICSFLINGNLITGVCAFCWLSIFLLIDFISIEFCVTGFLTENLLALREAPLTVCLTVLLIDGLYPYCFKMCPLECSLLLPP